MKTAVRVNVWERLEARIRSQEKTLLVQAARLEGRSITDFVVSSALQDARRVIRENELILLNARDQKIFVEALLHPPEPNAALRAAYQEYKKASSPLTKFDPPLLMKTEPVGNVCARKQWRASVSEHRRQTGVW